MKYESTEIKCLSRTFINNTEDISMNQNSNSHSISLCEDMQILDQSIWKQDNHRSIAINQPNFQELNLQHSCQLATPLLNLTADFLDCQFAEFHYPDKSYYQGQSKNSMRFGQGTYYFINGEKVMGYFVNDLPVGRFHYLKSPNFNIVYHGGQWFCIKKGKSVNGFFIGNIGHELHIGQLKNGHFYGQGKLFHKNQVYVGQFKESMHGNGFSKGSDGTLQIGSHVQGYCQGKAIQKNQNGTLLIGNWTLNLADGFGKCIDDKVIQEGNYVRGFRHGCFVAYNNEFYQNGYYYNNTLLQATVKLKLKFQIYVGQLKDGQPNGQGASYDDFFQIGQLNDQISTPQYRISYKNDSHCFKGYAFNPGNAGIGYFSTSQAKILGRFDEKGLHGDGISIDPQKMIKVGRWTHGKLNGYGKILYRDNSYYEGDFFEDQYNGEGTFNEGKFKYVGQWLKGKKSGKGKLTWDKNAYYEGDWFDNQFHGIGTYEDGKFKYVGDWIQGKKCGKGKAIDEDNSVYIGEWLNDQRHGLGSHVDCTGTELNGLWHKNNYCHGVHRSKNSLISFKGINMMEQLVINYGQTKQHKQQAQFTFFDQGQISKITNQLCILSPDGKVKYVGQVSDGKKNGLATQIDSESLFSGYFKDEQLNGLGYLLENQYSMIIGLFHQSKLVSGYVKSKSVISIGKFQENFDYQGIQVMPNGDFQIGDFSKGLLNGYGIVYIHQPQTYCEGLFSHGQMAGNCQYKKFGDEIVQSNQKKFSEIYLGQCRNNSYHGQASCLYNEQIIYMQSGNWEDGRPQGHFSTILNRDIHQGYQFRDYAFGILKSQNNVFYLGQWQQNQQNCDGTAINKALQFISVGNFVEGLQQKHGYRIKIEKGQQYVSKGYFINDRIQGNSLMKDPNYLTMIGQAKDGPIIFGIRVHHGHAYLGQFYNGQRHGQGVQIINRGICCYEGTWSHDLEDGYGIFYTHAGKIQQYYEKGKLIQEQLYDLIINY